jgi:hypothetical protein
LAYEGQNIEATIDSERVCCTRIMCVLTPRLAVAGVMFKSSIDKKSQVQTEPFAA